MDVAGAFDTVSHQKLLRATPLVLVVWHDYATSLSQVYLLCMVHPHRAPTHSSPFTGRRAPRGNKDDALSNS